MPDPIELRDKLLRENGVLLRRNGPHPVWKLNNGELVTISKTPNATSAWTEVTKIRRKLGIREVDMPAATIAHTLKDQLATIEDTPVVEPTIETPAADPPKDPLQLLVDNKIAELQQKELELLAEENAVHTKLEGVRTQIAKMAKVIDLVADPDLRDTLLELVTPVKTKNNAKKHYAPVICKICKEPINARWQAKHMAEKHPTSGNPQSISDAVMVTKQLVLAATQTFNKPFTTRELINLMIGDKKPNQAEQSRISQSVSATLVSLSNDGSVTRVKRGYANIPATWQKIDITKLRK